MLETRGQILGVDLNRSESSLRSAKGPRSRLTQRSKGCPCQGDADSDEARELSCGLSLILVAQPVETLLHLLHLALEVVDFLAAAARLRIALVRFSRRLSLAPCERREHGKRAFEHLHVPPHLILERAERAAAESVRHMLAEFFLLAGQRVDGDFEIARHQHLHAVAVQADELTQEGDGQETLPLLVLLLEDDLRQDLAGDVL